MNYDRIAMCGECPIIEKFDTAIESCLDRLKMAREHAASCGYTQQDVTKELRRLIALKGEFLSTKERHMALAVGIPVPKEAIRMV